MVTLSWYAWLALRRRVSMSAIGSVMVMSSSNPSHRGSRRTRRAFGDACWLPGGLRDTGQLAQVCHVTDADAAKAELAVDRIRQSAPLTAGVGAHRELRLGGRLENQRLLGHGSVLLAVMTVQLASSLNGKPRSLSNARPSSSVVAVVTTVMSMPRTRSMRSWSISWNTDCSVRPNV